MITDELEEYTIYSNNLKLKAEKEIGSIINNLNEFNNLNEPYDYFLIDTNMNYKIVDKEKLYNLYYDIYLKNRAEIYINYNDFKNLPSLEKSFRILMDLKTEEEILSNIEKFQNFTKEEVKNIYQTFFKNHFNKLFGFGSFLFETDTFLVFQAFENIVGINENFNLFIEQNFQKLYELGLHNFYYLSQNFPTIDYSYNLQSFIYDKYQNYYFTNLKNFEITFFTNWVKIEDPISKKEIDISKIKNHKSNILKNLFNK